ncbi:MAG: tRNA (adenosine(37)-N6)-dimethylallyltransferase MiaA [Betaproteobacteria bacterium]|nr:tRNA (adenosine(37)-N6)-dimethylallyltransferase MiaA [Betaproteobacteria bacterium]
MSGLPETTAHAYSRLETSGGAAPQLAVTEQDPLSRWVGLVGPTASGKSGIGLMVAHKVPVEIISVDSALVYRGMDIGTAKPTVRQRAQIAHHLIDLMEPTERYSAARFAQDARALIRQVNARGRLPLLVGGTMLYIKALMEGLASMPSTDPAVRDSLIAEGRTRGWPALHADLHRVDPVTADRLQANDAQRIQRALEVWRQTGRPLSSFHSAAASTQAGMRPRLLISLEPRERSWLHERIVLRLDYMLDEGFLEEVRALRNRGDLGPDLPSMRSVGYRQAWQALDAGLAGEALRQTVRETSVAATRQLAKRQLTWLRSIPERQVLDAQDAATADAVLALVAAHGDPAC